LTGELVYSDRPETRYDAADEALEVARIVGDDLTTFDVLFWRSTSARPLDGSWRDDELAELLAIAERGSDPLRTAMADMVTVMRGLHVGDIAGAEQALAATADLADQLRLPLLRWLVTIVRATCVTLGGRLDDGEKLVQEAFELSQATDQPDALAWYGVQLYMVRFQQARLAEMIPLLAGASSSTPTLLTWHAALALAYAEVDQLDAAERVTSMLIEAGYPQRPQEPHWVIGMSCLGSALAAIGRDPKGMQAAYDALLPRARIWASIMPLSLGSNERVLGELALALGRTEDAVGHFERAVRSNDAGPSPTFAALARVGLIQALRKSGDAERAATIADEVSAAVDRHGLARVADRLEAALAGDPAT
jgi:tetratricopeptide (TPR) repeat protein